MVSNTHPTADWGRFGGSYFDERWVKRPIGPGGESIEYQLMPLHIFVNEVLEANFTLDRLIEPVPTPALRDVDAVKYEELSAAPIFLALKLHI